MKLSNYIKSFLMVIPLVFILIFYGYLYPKFDLVFYTDSIVGDGIGTVTLCSPQPFAPFYAVNFYFGSQLKTALIKGIHFDVRYLPMVISDIKEAELDSYDVLFHGIKIGHYEIEDRLVPGEYDGVTVSLTDDNQRAHLVIKDPDIGTTIGFDTHFPPSWFWIAYIGIIIFFSAILALLLCFITNRYPRISIPLINVAAIAVSLLAGSFFCGSFPYVDYTYFLLNWLFVYAFSLALSSLMLPWLGTILTMTITTVCYIANYYVITFRNKPIMPADLKAFGTATEVMGNYTYTPNLQMIIGIMIVIAYGIIVIIVHKNNKPEYAIPINKQLLGRGASFILAILLILGGLNSSTFKNLDSFAWDAVLLKNFHEEGMVLTFLKSVINSKVEKPKGYSKEIVDGYLAEYEPQDVNGIQPTNIIMVMNEAFSDLRTVGLDEKINVMPFIDSLDENTIKGSLYVSVFGGGTCNTEFEALTGNTLAFLGIGAYPYTENVTEPLFSLASYFKSLGYDTEAFHANEAQNWNRNMVYPNLGFNDFHAIDDYYKKLEDVPYLHKHPADIADYKYIEEVNAEHSGQTRFLFNVTMQNHSGYERWEDVEKDKSVERYGSNLYPDTQIYLSLIKASDDEIRQLIETYEKTDEPTMIVFFGDHQPGLPAYAQREFYTDVDSYIDWYKSMFFIWTNYETTPLHDIEISANYLPYLILKQGNFQMPAYIQMLEEIYEQYPVISAMGVIDAEGNIYGSVNEVIEDPLIKKYQYVQYANMFDKIDDAWFYIQ